MGKRPSSLKVGIYAYRIVWFDKKYMEDANTRGYYSAKDGEIGVYEGLENTELAEVFLHETTHAVNDFMDIVDTTTEEVATELGARGMTMVWRDNKPLFKWWVELLK